MRPLILALALVFASAGSATAASKPPLWRVYDQSLQAAPSTSTSPTPSRRRSPSGRASAPRRSRPTVNPGTGQPYTYADRRLRGDALRAADRPVRHPARPAGPLGAGVPGHRRAAAHVRRSARWSSSRSSSRSPKTPATHLQVADIERWEAAHGRIPRGLGGDGALGLVEALARPGAGDARRSSPACRSPRSSSSTCKRHILFHGHEPLDTDTDADARGRVAG